MTTSKLPLAKPEPGHSWWERVVVQRSSNTINALVDVATKSSSFLQESGSFEESLATFQRQEIEIGAALGKGTYSNVFEVSGIHLCSGNVNDQDDRDARDRVGKSVSDSHGNTKYAIKHLKPELLKNSRTFESAAADLLLEARFLTLLNHPNILKIRGVAGGGAMAYSMTGQYDGYFIIIDKIKETLLDRLKRWKGQQLSGQSLPSNSILAKIDIALQVAGALSYLHERRLVFRDLKPHNIGLKADGTVQLFDFGFCRELPSPPHAHCKIERGDGTLQSFLDARDEVDAYPSEDEILYAMSGKGTLMYMSPEVLGTRRYNQKADVYGWAAIFYEMLTLSRPYVLQSLEGHRQAICKHGVRPPLNRGDIPRPIQHLLQNCWDGNIRDRFTMSQATSYLSNIIQDFSAEGSLVLETTPWYMTPLSLTSLVETLFQPVVQSFTRMVDDIQRAVAVSFNIFPVAHSDHLSLRHKGNASTDANTTMSISCRSSLACFGSTRTMSANSEPNKNNGELSVVVEDDSVETVLAAVEGADPSNVPVEKSVGGYQMKQQTTSIKEEKNAYATSEAQSKESQAITRADILEEQRRQRISLRSAPFGCNGTLVYHKYYGHVNFKSQEGSGRKDRLWKTLHAATTAQGRHRFHF